MKEATVKPPCVKGFNSSLIQHALKRFYHAPIAGQPISVSLTNESKCRNFCS